MKHNVTIKAPGYAVHGTDESFDIIVDGMKVAVGDIVRWREIDERKWIAVTERLPPYKRNVFVSCAKEVGMAFRSHTDADGEHFTDPVDDQEWMQVGHWMELPPLPTKAQP